MSPLEGSRSGFVRGDVMKNATAAGLLLLVCACWLTQASAASPARADVGEHWTAQSTTAEAITGNVTFSPRRITFATRASLTIAPVATLHRTTWAGSDTHAAAVVLYRVVGRSDPALLRGNRLCGSPAAFASIVRKHGPSTPPHSDDIELAIFTGDPTPARSSESRLCATYIYSYKHPGF